MAVERVGVSFEPELLSRFDALIREKGYASRSEALRDLARESIAKAEMDSGSGTVMGTLTILYDHDASGLSHRLVHVQHEHHADVMSTLHVHVDERNCLEVLLIKGERSDVKLLADRIRALKGVALGELALVKADA
ncbi:MAG: nickel-responsive transcriptional regulator NikR [Methanobacteriota archaeon]